MSPTRDRPGAARIREEDGGREIMVSVCVVTYNQARFIGQALDSVLGQETGFPFEICIGEDDSDDGTREICEGYARRHPKMVRLFLRHRRDVIYVDGQATGRYNLERTLQECRGRYVALLEGDDYWTCRHKLQRQVDFLERHPEAAACGHDVISVDENGAVNETFSWRKPPAPMTGTREMLEWKSLPTPSLVFRNVLREFPEWMFGLKMADWPMLVLLSLHGRMGFLPEAMAAVRRHEGGVWSRLGAREVCRADLCFYETLRAVLDARYRKQIDRRRHETMAELAALEGAVWSARWQRFLAAASAGPLTVVRKLAGVLARGLGHRSDRRNGYITGGSE